MPKSKAKQTVCIVGGGMSGAVAAIRLRSSLEDDIDVVVVDKRNNYTYVPLLFELLAKDLPDNICCPNYSSIFTSGITYIEGKVIDVDFEQNFVKLNDLQIHFDYLVLAVGAISTAQTSSKLRTFYTADDVKDLQIILSEIETRKRVAVVGGGFTGVELATTLRYNYKSKLDVMLIESQPTILSAGTNHNRRTSER